MNRRTFVLYGLAAVASLSKNIAYSKPKPSFTADLSTELTTVGSSAIKKNIIVVRIAEENAQDSFIALSAKCTHMGCKVKYSTENANFVCPCHKSIFAADGKVIEGPAKKPLTQYKISIADNTLTVLDK